MPTVQQTRFAAEGGLRGEWESGQDFLGHPSEDFAYCDGPNTSVLVFFEGEQPGTAYG